ncbi:hypothetical protein Scep_002437 [Stephania cephalantha]|uniref:Uncharacterized protein n=1 Tax=Stephania cephalantha TaxID=152367 RepID=A0AAP0Q8S3_9MAGN
MTASAVLAPPASETSESREEKGRSRWWDRRAQDGESSGEGSGERETARWCATADCSGGEADGGDGEMEKMVRLRPGPSWMAHECTPLANLIRWRDKPVALSSIVFDREILKLQRLGSIKLLSIGNKL